MKGYDSYKDSGIEWIGEIPSNWNVKKLKFVCKIFNGDSLKDEEKELFSQEIENSIPYVSTKDIDVWTSKINYENGLKIPVDHSRYKIAPKNSFLMCIEGGSAGRKYAHLQKDVFFVNKLACFETQSENNKFLYYYSQSPLFQSQFQNSLSGLIGGVAISQIRNFSVILPIPDEQTTIANYLDQKTSEIDNLIAKKERLIQLLEEERIAIINQAVTKGLDPTVPMKDSGIEWLGEIPAHWEVPKIWHLVMMKKMEIQDGNHGSLYPKQEDFKTEGIYFIKPRDIRSGGVNFETCDCLTSEHASSLRIGFAKPNDLLLVNRGGTIGRMARMKTIPNELEYVVINPQMTYIRCNEGLDSDFTYYQCISDVFQESLEQVKAFGSTFSFLGLSNMGDFPFVIPPIHEQIKISEFINQKLDVLNNIVYKIIREIDLIKEYKTALISEVVTGKVDVRKENINKQVAI